MRSRRDGTTFATVLLVATNLLIPVAILAFATGFFPYKPFLPGLALYEDLPEYGDPPAAPFDRVVFMVVDALRSDFVFLPGMGFEYTQSLIRDGAAIPFTAHATSPTITMPRIKAITTGSIPSFLDVILNFDEADTSSTLAAQDTWLAQMKAKRTGKLVLYGDDTWLKLFPETFDRADGTSSFFVADFTEVDNNVTRHVPEELGNDDWNTMVLHYLGLDHIGHKAGPRSPNMVPKQREMDGIVRSIYNAIETKDHLRSTLLVLCGDHGMNDAGNHGASSSGETSPALVFMSPKLKELPNKYRKPVEYQEDFQYYTTVEQSDLAPTLAALLGFPVPKNNLGAFMVDFLPFWSSKNDRIAILMRNGKQILKIITATFGAELFEQPLVEDVCSKPGSDIQELACDWQRIARTAESVQSAAELDPQWVSDTSKWLHRAQGLMSSMASNYDMPRLFLGITVSAVAVTCALGAFILSVREPISSALPFAAVTVAYGVMMFASSYVEEEHHFWYWATTAWLVLLGLKGMNRKTTSQVGPKLTIFLFASVAMRLVRSWNQTGQKFAGEPDLVKIFLVSNPALLWCLVGATYLWIHRELARGFEALPDVVTTPCGIGLILSAFTFKASFTQEDAPELVIGFVRSLANIILVPSLVTRARAVFIGLAVANCSVLCAIFAKKRISFKLSPVETLHHLYTLLAMTQSRATNIPLFLLFNIQKRFLASQDLTTLELTATSLLLQFTSFFAFGGTNAISSVDLSSAYNGVSGYSVIAVGVLTFVSNWAGPIYWTSATAVLLLQRSKQQKERGRAEAVFLQYAAVLTTFAACSVAAVMAACTVLRTHLFIWTVFSPKYLYCMAWSLGQHLVVNLGFGGLLFWLGSR